MAEVNPDCLWLSESVEPVFTRDNRERGMVSLSDAEIHQAFDVSYEYDVYHDWVRLLLGECGLEEYALRVTQQEYLYPDNYVKLRFLENHDRPRAAFLIPDARARRNWTAFMYFQKGMALVYNGQERENDFRPSLFDKDDIRWDTGSDISPFLRRLYEMKRNPLFADSRYDARGAGNGMLVATHRAAGRRMTGVFSTEGRAGLVRVDVPEGLYENLVDGSGVRVEGGLRHARASRSSFSRGGRDEHAGRFDCAGRMPAGERRSRGTVPHHAAHVPACTAGIRAGRRF